MKCVLGLKFILLFSLGQEISSKENGDQSESLSGQVIVKGNNNFALKLLNVLGSHKTNDNLFFSPTSLSVALAMVVLGARGTTAKQIVDAFNWNGQPHKDIHTAMKDLHQKLHGAQQEQFELRLANRIWGKHNITLVPYFARAIKEFYGSEMTLSDFEREADRVTIEVNHWVLQQSNGKIKDFLPPGILNSDTMLALINVIYFKGRWKYEFDKQNTFPAPFYAFGNHENEVEVEMMTMTANVKFHFDEDAGCRIMQLPYSGDHLSMVVILPERLNGLSELVKILTMEKLDSWMQSMTKTKVSVALPKFQLNQQFELSEVLPKLGINDVFDSGRADLRGISETTRLFVSKFIHKAYIETNEKGTEAAAVSGVVIVKRSLDMNQIFYADHPFLFLILHQLSGSILFAGSLLQPVNNREHKHNSNDQHIADEL